MAIGVGLAAVPAGFLPYLPHPPFKEYIPEVDLPVDDERYPYLLLIDEYDETVFSAHQCRVMEPDFARLAGERGRPQVRASARLSPTVRCVREHLVHR